MPSPERVSLYSLGVNLTLVGLKGVFAVLSGSLALLADTIHSLSDVVAAGAVWVGLRLSQRKSAQFPYGLYKVENLVSLGVAAAIFFAAYEIAKEVLFGGSAHPLRLVPWTVGAMGLEVLIACFFSRYERRLAQALGSPSLKADAEHLRTHIFSGAVIIVGLIGSAFGWPLDRLAAVVVIGFILEAGWHVLSDSVRVLLDASLDFDTLEKAKRVILNEPKVKELKSLRGRNSGRYKFLEADIVLKGNDLERAHRLATQIEERLRETIAHVDRVTIHVEPQARANIRYAIPLEADDRVSLHLGEAPRFALLDVRAADRHLLTRHDWSNQWLALEHGKGIRVAEFLAASDVDAVLLREKLHGRGPAYVFSDAGIEVIETKQENLEELLDELGIVRGVPHEKETSP